MKLAVDHLPKSARLIAQVIGLPATLALVEHYAGQRFTPPKAGADYAALAEVIGEAAAAKLAAHFREPIDVPKCQEAMRAVVHDALREDFDALTHGPESLSARRAVTELVRRYGYVDRYVWRLLKQADTSGAVVDSAQAELF